VALGQVRRAPTRQARSAARLQTARNRLQSYQRHQAHAAAAPNLSGTAKHRAQPGQKVAGVRATTECEDGTSNKYDQYAVQHHSSERVCAMQ
jgi:hypothetical protein